MSSSIWTDFLTVNAYYPNVVEKTNEQAGALSFPDKPCVISLTPKGWKSWLAQAGNPILEPGIGCTRQPTPLRLRCTRHCDSNADLQLPRRMLKRFFRQIIDLNCSNSNLYKYFFYFHSNSNLYTNICNNVHTNTLSQNLVYIARGFH